MLPYLFREGRGSRDSDKRRNSREVPRDSLHFDAHRAYEWIVWQVQMGPRVPGTPSHRKVADSIARYMERYCLRTYIQQDTMRRYDGKPLPLINLFCQLSARPGKDRFLLVAHWDTRPWRDQDPDSFQWFRPLAGAIDGASGVAILLELIRVLAKAPPPVNVDVLLVDGEDQGPPEFEETVLSDADPLRYWCLGMQMWIRSPAVPLSMYRGAVVLDMVGARDARFYPEGWSIHYASFLVRSLWLTAHRLGYISRFLPGEMPPITDDHYFLNVDGNIPAMVLIHLDPRTSTGFPDWWHTSRDTLTIVDPATLEVVGRVMEAWLRWGWSNPLPSL